MNGLWNEQHLLGALPQTPLGATSPRPPAPFPCLDAERFDERLFATRHVSQGGDAVSR